MGLEDKKTLSLLSGIKELKAQRNAVILAHNYQMGEVQDIADFVGDSLELTQQAAKTEAEVIVFCGVHFMAETAAILCPDKTVLLPDLQAGCPMADMIDVQGLRRMKSQYPEATVVCYINSSAAVKAESDICCTSGNALKMVERIPPDQEIIFIPDQYLGGYISAKSRRSMHLWPGYCPTHLKIIPRDILSMKEKHPEARVIVHPECHPEVTALADVALGTGGMRRYVKENDAREFIVGTEVGILHGLRKSNPGKQFYPASEMAACPNMKRINLEKILWAMEEMTNQITVPEETSTKARKAIQRMLEVFP
jgi:quinolinate synthase